MELFLHSRERDLDSVFEEKLVVQIFYFETLIEGTLILSGPVSGEIVMLFPVLSSEEGTGALGGGHRRDGYLVEN